MVWDVTLLWPFVVISQTFLQLILHNLDVEVPIHLAINLAGKSRPFPEHTAPHHQGTTTKLHSPFHKPITEALPWPFPDPFLAI
jgi:hypothetical protein